MDDLADLGGLHTCFLTDPLNAFDDGVFGCGVGGEYFGGMAFCAVFEDDVGEGAADVYAEAD